MTLYERLGLAGPQVDEKAIKAAYRRLVKKHHPDAGGKADEFRPIQEAYDVLSDPKKRARYDATGEIPKAGPSEALATLKGILDAIVGRIGPHQNPFELARREIQANVHTFNEQIREAQNNEKRLLEIQSRSKAKDPTNDVFSPIVAQRIEVNAGRLANLRNALAIAAEILPMLDEYEFTPRPEPETRYSFGLQLPPDCFREADDAEAGQETA